MAGWYFVLWGFDCWRDFGWVWVCDCAFSYLGWLLLGLLMTDCCGGLQLCLMFLWVVWQGLCLRSFGVYLGLIRCVVLICLSWIKRFCLIYLLF